MPVTAIGGSMSWGEAVRLTHLLMRDPASQVCAAINEWQSPRSREWFILADLFDLMHTINSKNRPDPYPRPTDEEKHFGMKPTNNADVFTALRKHGHKIT